MNRVILQQEREEGDRLIPVPTLPLSPSPPQQPLAVLDGLSQSVAGSSLLTDLLSLCHEPVQPAHTIVAPGRGNNCSVQTSVSVAMTVVPSEATHIPVGSSPDSTTLPSLQENRDTFHRELYTMFYCTVSPELIRGKLSSLQVLVQPQR